MKTNRLLISILIVALLSATGCAVFSASYKAPSGTQQQDKYVKTINASYDKVWSTLIQYSAKTFFAIENYEKASGLITLSFGASNPVGFVTGGHVEYGYAGGTTFSGDYVEYLTKFGEAELDGKLNIVVTKVSENKTKVSVNARYIFTGGVRGNYRWVFDTGGCDTVTLGTPMPRHTPYKRTVCPTYKVEDTIIRTLEKNIQEK